MEFNIYVALYGDLPEETMSERLKKLRLMSGFRQAHLAKLLGLTVAQGRNVIKDYETRRIYPSKEISQKLASIFNIGTKYFYDDYYNFLDSDYYNILKRFRQENKLTQKEAAALINVSGETWNAWENGRVVIKRESYLKLKKILRQ